MEYLSSTLSFYRRSSVVNALCWAFHALCIALFLLFGLTLFELSNSASLDAQLKQVQNQMLQLKNEEKLTEWMAENKAKVDALLPELSRSVSQPELMQTLIQSARKSDISIEGFTFEQVFSNQQYTKYQVMLTLSGPYPKVKKFTTELADIRGYSLINQVQFRQLERDNVATKIGLEVTQL